MVSNAIGLWALLSSLIHETIGRALGKKTMGTTDMLQRVFAQEKNEANEVRPWFVLVVVRLSLVVTLFELTDLITVGIVLLMFSYWKLFLPILRISKKFSLKTFSHDSQCSTLRLWRSKTWVFEKSPQLPPTTSTVGNHSWNEANRDQS